MPIRDVRPGLPLSAVLDLLDRLLEETVDERAAAAPLAGHVEAAELAEVTRRVHRIRSSLSRWRRRDQELSALFSSARELAELRDVDLLLDRLVARAHDLVGTDVTYLSEFYQDTDELRVRSTLGTVTPSFRHLRVPPGMGLASKVVQTRSPQWTSRYDRYTEAPHLAAIDTVVREEGLVSLLGVPMVAGDRVLGALFAANRSEHAFAPEEIALLSAFADHAAVVLQTTRLLAQARTLAKEAQEANAYLARTMAAMERASAVHQDLTEVVLRGGTAHEVARTLSRELSRSVGILDRELAPLAEVVVGDGPAMPGAPRQGRGDREGVGHRIRAAVDRSRSTGRCVFPDGDFPEAGRGDPAAGRSGDRVGSPAVVVAVVAAETLLGAILVGPGELALEEVEQRTIERAAQIVALLALKQEATAEAEERVRGELIADILRVGPETAGGEREDLVLRARTRGVRLETLTMAIVAVVPREQRRAAVHTVQSHGTGLLTGEHAGCVVVLNDEEDPTRAAAHVREVIGPALDVPVLAVAGPPVGSYRELGSRFELLRGCAELLSGIGVDDAAVNADAYRPYLALFGSRQEEITAFTEAVLGPVLHWDRERGTDLMATLTGFVDSQASSARTARAVNVHINTITQRLERITALLGPGWRDPEPYFRITVAARMHALMTSAQRPAR